MGGIAVSTLVISTTNYSQILMVNSEQQPFIILTESIKILMIPVDGPTKILGKVIILVDISQVLVVNKFLEKIRNPLDISGVMAILILILNALVTIYIG